MDSGPSIEAFILNVSANGFRLSVNAPLSVGDSITITHNGLRSRGHVLWAEGTEAGGSFLDQVSCADSDGRMGSTAQL